MGNQERFWGIQWDCAIGFSSRLTGVRVRTYISAKDCRSLLTLIGQLYTLPDQGTVVRAVVDGLKNLVPFSSGVYIAMEASGLFRLDGHVLVDIPEKALSAFTSYYAAIHPFTLSGWVRRTNEAARISDFVPPNRLQNTEYGRDFLPMTSCFSNPCPIRRHCSRNFPDGTLRIARERSF